MAMVVTMEVVDDAAPSFHPRRSLVPLITQGVQCGRVVPSLSPMPTRILRSPIHPQRQGFPLQLTFSYIARSRGHSVEAGLGETLEIGSSYVRIRPLVVPAVVTDFVISINWPAMLPDGTRLQLIVQARSVDASPTVSRLEILKYEFRTAQKFGRGSSRRQGSQSVRSQKALGASGSSTPYLQMAAASWA